MSCVHQATTRRYAVADTREGFHLFLRAASGWTLKGRTREWEFSRKLTDVVRRVRDPKISREVVVLVGRAHVDGVVALGGSPAGTAGTAVVRCELVVVIV